MGRIAGEASGQRVHVIPARQPRRETEPMEDGLEYGDCA